MIITLEITKAHLVRQGVFSNKDVLKMKKSVLSSLRDNLQNLENIYEARKGVSHITGVSYK